MNIKTGKRYGVISFEKALKDSCNDAYAVTCDSIHGISKAKWDLMAKGGVVVRHHFGDTVYAESEGGGFYVPVGNLRELEDTENNLSTSQMADIILEEDLSLRQAGKRFGMSYSTLALKLKEELALTNREKYYRIKAHLEKNRRNKG